MPYKRVGSVGVSATHFHTRRHSGASGGTVSRAAVWDSARCRISRTRSLAVIDASHTPTRRKMNHAVFDRRAHVPFDAHLDVLDDVDGWRRAVEGVHLHTADTRAK